MTEPRPQFPRSGPGGEGTFPTLLRYILVGGSSFVLDLGILTVLTERLGVWYIASATAAFLVAFFYSFLLTKHFAFRAGGAHGPQLLRYTMLVAMNYIVSIALLYGLTEYAHLHYVLSRIVAQGVVVCWNFVAYRTWVYR